MLQQRTKMILVDWDLVCICAIVTGVVRCCQVFIGVGALVQPSEGVKEQTRTLAVSFPPSIFHHLFLD